MLATYLPFTDSYIQLFYFMTSLQRLNPLHSDSHRPFIDIYKLKNSNIKHRHYSSSKLIKTIVLNESKSQNFIQKNCGTDAVEMCQDKKELKKYCISKFKAGNVQEKVVLKRKNSSLKLFKRDETIKYYTKLKNDAAKSKGSPQDKKDDRNSASLSRETFSSQQTIPIKRRIELLKINNSNRPKLQIKDQNFEKKSLKSDVSFEEKLGNIHLEQSKIHSSQKIRSENVLGNGLRKCSSNKIKILVKNPFERHIKHQEALQQQLNQVSIEQIPEEFKESRIVTKFEQSFPSMDHNIELQQLLAMI